MPYLCARLILTMDRNTITGFALLAVLVITYFAYNNYSQKEYEKKKTADSIAYAKAHPVADSRQCSGKGRRSGA